MACTSLQALREGSGSALPVACSIGWRQRTEDGFHLHPSQMEHRSFHQAESMENPKPATPLKALPEVSTLTRALCKDLWRSRTTKWGLMSPALSCPYLFYPFMCKRFTEFFFIHVLFLRKKYKALLCPFRHALANHGRMLHSFTLQTWVQSLNRAESSNQGPAQSRTFKHELNKRHCSENSRPVPNIATI